MFTRMLDIVNFIYIFTFALIVLLSVQNYSNSTQFPK